MNFFTHDQLISAVKHLHPELTHGRQFLVLMEIQQDGTPTSDAWIEQWTASYPPPGMQELREAYAAVVSAAALQPPAPPAALSCTSLQYMSRFNETEKTAIFTAATQSAQLLRFVTELAAAQEIVFADPRLSAGMDALVAGGLVTQARSLEILPLSVRSSGVPPL